MNFEDFAPIFKSNCVISFLKRNLCEWSLIENLFQIPLVAECLLHFIIVDAQGQLLKMILTNTHIPHVEIDISFSIQRGYKVSWMGPLYISQYHQELSLLCINADRCCWVCKDCLSQCSGYLGRSWFSMTPPSSEAGCILLMSRSGWNGWIGWIPWIGWTRLIGWIWSWYSMTPPNSKAGYNLLMSRSHY